MKRSFMHFLSWTALCLVLAIPFACRKNIEQTAVLPAATATTALTLSKLAVLDVYSPARGLNLVNNIVDGNLSSEWFGSNDPAVYPPNPNSQIITLQLDTSRMHIVSYVRMGFSIFGNKTLRYNFDVLVSQNGRTGWVTVLNAQNSGAGNAGLQTFDFPDTRGNYIRIVGHGNNGAAAQTNNVPPENSRYSEVEVYGSDAPAITSTKLYIPDWQASASSTVSPYVPANAVDGKFNTYWTSKMTTATDYKNLTVNLGSVHLVDFIKVSFYTGGDAKRVSRFGVLVSTDSISWTKVVANTYSALNEYGEALESFDFPDVSARYVRIECYGHTGSLSSSAFNSINEMQVWAAPAIVPACRINTFVLPEDNKTYRVYYNAHGDPDSATAPGSLSYVFTYNTSHQLIAFYPGYTANPATRPVHKYTYSAGRILTDSAYYPMGNGNYQTDNSILYWDASGRLTREYRNEIIKLPDDYFQRTDDFRYEYDINGNLKSRYSRQDPPYYQNPVVYDNSISYLRTNPIWMFISRDYSQNNTKRATSYTQSGLPLGFATDPNFFSLHYFLSPDYNTNLDTDPKLITYTCQ